ncbi:multicopper oxidase domain-containing protein [Thorsellia kenyensis]|uniref:Multicopper oxidase domain-containing protein n=1 Tax=Thorsellia kenyensis TaxID=1549888 RepID=A0ABV6CHX2_9GAMM
MNKSVSRRDFIKTSLIGSAGLVLSSNLKAKSPTVTSSTLPIPPLAESKRGQAIFLTAQKCQWNFTAGVKSTVLGFNGLHLGPTIRVRNGDNVKVIYSNRLAETISVNIQGLHLPSSLMGGYHHPIGPNQSWSPVLPIRQYYSNCYYHAAIPKGQSEKTYLGLTGLWLIEDEHSSKMDLPKQYGVDDIPLLIQDVRLENDGQLVFKANSNEGFLGNQLSVNGAISPTLNVPRQMIRFRLYNHANSRQLQIKLSSQSLFYVISNEQGFLAKPILVPSLSLSPGQRIEIIIDMANEETVNIEAGQALSFWDKTKQLFESSDALLSNILLTLQPIGDKPLIKEKLPITLVENPVVAGDYIKTRELSLDNDPPGINLSSWDPKRIDTYAKLGTWEKWTIKAKFPQSFSLQGAVFLIKSVNGAPPLPENRGLCDTVWIDGTVELLIYFTHVSSPQIPFVYGSRNLTLQDAGALAQLVVEPR